MESLYLGFPFSVITLLVSDNICFYAPTMANIDRTVSFVIRFTEPARTQTWHRSTLTTSVLAHCINHFHSWPWLFVRFYQRRHPLAYIPVAAHI